MPGSVPGKPVTLLLALAPPNCCPAYPPFDPLGADQGQTNGTALGLTVTKALIEAMRRLTHGR